MNEKKRPFNPVISMTGDTFQEGQDPIERVIVDLSKESDSSLELLSKVYPEALYEILWRSLYSSEN